MVYFSNSSELCKDNRENGENKIYAKGFQPFTRIESFF